MFIKCPRNQGYYLFGRRKMLNLQVIAYIQCLVNGGLKKEKKYLYLDFWRYQGMLWKKEILWLLIDVGMEYAGIFWQWFPSKCSFLENQFQENLKQKSLRFWRVLSLVGELTFPNFKKMHLTGFLQQHLESFALFHPESWTVTQNGVVGPQSILLRVRSVKPPEHFLIFPGV